MRARVAATAALAVGLMLGTAGCTFITPQATLNPYDASDGISGTIGNIDVRNAFAVSSDGIDASFNGAIINNADVSKRVQIQYTSHATSPASLVNEYISVPAGGSVSFGTKDVPQLVLEGADVKAGALLTVFIQYGTESGKKLRIPVLDGTQAAYTHLVPTPTPTPTEVPLPGPTKTAKPVTD